uniref:TSA: Wollemia nobilis Ref_Wollemi_Transcript_30068_1006 transcribed RNA sequence n=1 Tax=Wollemia nobilis TaxID=56998 RepID=A0A0C9S3B7_9CONI
MVGSAVAVKKLWKSLRTSVTATGRVVKQKLTKNKKKKRSKERYDHYNFSDDEEPDNQLKKKLRGWKIKAMTCVVGKAEIEPPTGPFVYVTDLYSSTSSSAVGSQDVKGEAEKTKEVEKENGGATGSSPALSGDSSFPEKAPASPSKKKKIVGLSFVAEAENEKGVGKGMAVFKKEVDTEADLFIARFHDEMRLQRQKSVAEYHEMINRGASSAAV